MDNASKALIIAGSMLISIAIISLFMFFYNNISDFYSTKNSKDELENISSFNRFFEESSYDVDRCGSGVVHVNGWDVYNILKKVESINDDLDNEHSIIVKGAITSSDYFLNDPVEEINYYAEDFDESNPPKILVRKPKLDVLSKIYEYSYEATKGGYITSVTFN